MESIDWSRSSDVERRNEFVSGAWVIKGTRVPVAAVLDNADDGYTPEQIASEIYEGVQLDSVRNVIEFARAHAQSSA